MADEIQYDFGDPMFSTGFRVTEHVPGYTGFIPKIQNNFATTFTCASRVAMCCPPTPDLETIQTDYTRARRRLQTSAPMAGTGFLGFLSEPEDQDNSRFKQYWQGSQVNLGEYYEDQKRKVDRMRIENPKGLTQKKNPIRNSSQIRFGDYFYYSGKHMFDTTQAESYDETRLTQPMGEALRLRTAELRAAAEPGYLPRTASSASSGSQATSTMSRPGFVKLDAHGRAKTRLIKSKHTTRSKTPEPNEDEPIAYRYKVAQAIVGKARLDALHREICDRVTSMVTTGKKDMYNIFILYAMKGKDLGHDVIGYEEFLSVCQKLGVYMTTREALGLFGRYDYNSDEMNGHVDYFEFIKQMFGESESIITASTGAKLDDSDDEK